MKAFLRVCLPVMGMACLIWVVYYAVHEQTTFNEAMHRITITHKHTVGPTPEGWIIQKDGPTRYYFGGRNEMGRALFAVSREDYSRFKTGDTYECLMEAGCYVINRDRVESLRHGD